MEGFLDISDGDRTVLDCLEFHEMSKMSVAGKANFVEEIVGLLHSFKFIPNQ